MKFNPEKSNTNEKNNPKEVGKNFEFFRNRGLPTDVWGDFIQKYQSRELYSYDETINRFQGTELHISGNDERIISSQEFSEFINESFNQDILRKSLVTAIYIRFDEVNYRAIPDNLLGLNPGEYYIPKDVFIKNYQSLSLDQQNIISKDIYRAESFAAWNRDSQNEATREILIKNKLVLPTPIALFNQEFDMSNIAIRNNNLKDAGLEYLSAVDHQDCKKKYILGTLAHEIGHNIFQHLIHNRDQEHEWKNIIDKNGDITEYARRYNNNGHKNYDENFCEAIRLYTTAYDWIEENDYIEIINYIEKNFPEIKKTTLY